MKFATLRTNKPDGELVVVSRDLTRMAGSATSRHPAGRA